MLNHIVLSRMIGKLLGFWIMEGTVAEDEGEAITMFLLEVPLEVVLRNILAPKENLARCVKRHGTLAHPEPWLRVRSRMNIAAAGGH